MRFPGNKSWQLIQHFPNMLPERRCPPDMCAEYLDALILEQNASRKGVLPDVAVELALLKTCSNRYIAARQFERWNERIGR